MTYVVTKIFRIKPQYVDEIPHSTIEEFKAHVLQHSANGEKGEDYYIELLRAANIPGWDEKEAGFIAARSNKTESFDDVTKEYTVTRTWESFDQWYEYSSCVNYANLQQNHEYLSKYYFEEQV